jgi:hypothetical protein
MRWIRPERKSSNLASWVMFLVVLLISCTGRGRKTLSIEALPINAEVKDGILYGPSVLNDPKRFVWGASVIRD